MRLEKTGLLVEWEPSNDDFATDPEESITWQWHSSVTPRVPLSIR